MALCAIEGCFSEAQAGRAFGVCAKIVARWLERYKVDGGVGMVDCSSRPHRRASCARDDDRDIIVLRRKRWTGKYIVIETGVSAASVSRALRRSAVG